MLSAVRWTGVFVVVIALSLFAAKSWAAEPIAFITEVAGQATIARAGGGKDAAEIGGQLFDGDEVTVGKGTLVMIYLSGRSVDVGAGSSLKVQKEGGESDTSLGRLMGTLGEMVGSTEEADRPVVHGMARNLPLTGAAPANTKISGTDFSFSWDALEGAEAYVFTLESEDGEVLATKTLQDSALSAGDLDLSPGKSYKWTVEAQFIIPHSTGANWLAIATEDEAEALGKSFREIEEAYTGTTESLLKAATYYKEGYYFEANQMLLALKGKEDLASVNRMLRLIQARMAQQVKASEPEE